MRPVPTGGVELYICRFSRARHVLPETLRVFAKTCEPALESVDEVESYAADLVRRVGFISRASQTSGTRKGPLKRHLPTALNSRRS